MTSFLESLKEEVKEKAEVVWLPTLDTSRAVDYIKQHQAAAEKMGRQLDKFDILTEPDCNELLGMAGTADDLIKLVEGERKRLISEPSKYVKAVNNAAKVLIGTKAEGLKGAVQRAKDRIGMFRYNLELERKKAEKAIADANIELQKTLDKQAAEAGVEPVTVEAAPLPKDKKVARAETGHTAHVRMKTEVEIVNPDEVERKYCLPSMQLLNQAVKAGVKELKGCKITEKPITVMR
jgi:hypothetical protein